MSGILSKPIRVGIVGCGSIARAHLDAYQADGKAEVVAVYDVSPPAAEALAREASAKACGSLSAMIDDHGVQAVSICTPPGVHQESCRPFLEAGIPLLCEKPLAIDLDCARKLAGEVKKRQGLFMMAFCHRFHPAILELKKLIDQGTLGEPLLFRNIFGGYVNIEHNHRAEPALSGGGCLVDHCAHSVDLFRFLAGEPTGVQALAGNIQQNVKVEDFGMIHLRTAGQAFGEITASYSLRVCGNWLEWYGTRGTAYVSYWNAGVPPLRYQLADSETAVTVDCGKHPERFVGEIRHFLSCVRTGEKPAVTIEDGLQANRIGSAIYESVSKGGLISI